jgi:hypothetical protein
VAEHGSEGCGSERATTAQTRPLPQWSSVAGTVDASRIEGEVDMILRFANCELDLARIVLRRDGHEVKLTVAGLVTMSKTAERFCD